MVLSVEQAVGQIERLPQEEILLPHLTARDFPSYMVPGEKLADPDKITVVDLSFLRPYVKYMIDYSQQMNTGREETGEKPVEVGIALGMIPAESRPIVPGKRAVGRYDGKHHRVLTDVHTMPANGRAPIFTEHSHVAAVREDEELISEPSHTDNWANVIKMPWGPLCPTSLVFTQLPDRVVPLMYVTLTTQETPLKSPEEWQQYMDTWDEQDTQQQMLAKAVHTAQKAASEQWKTTITQEMGIIPLNTEKKERGLWGPADEEIWSWDKQRLGDLYRKGDRLDQHPDVLAAQAQLEAFAYPTQPVFRRAAIADAKLLLLVADTWDMQFKRVEEYISFAA